MNLCATTLNGGSRVTTQKPIGLEPVRNAKGIFEFVAPDASATEPDGMAQGESLTAPGMPSAVVARLLDIHEYERKRMGQELHDSTGQLLVSLQLSVARLKSVDAQYKDNRVVEEILDTVREIDREIRTLAFLHYPRELGGQSICEAVGSLAQGFGTRTGIRTSFRCSGDTADVAEPILVAVLRVAQEALVNVHRHSRASSAKVTLERLADRLLLTVSDDGIGIPGAFDADRGRGIGLDGMRYRVETQGGQFDVKRLKHGTRVSANMPLVA